MFPHITPVRHKLTPTPMPPRRHWQLCSGHSSCRACKSAVDSWKQKAQRYGWNASRLKYALDCVLSGQNEVIYERGTGVEQLEPITTGMDDEPGPDDILNWTCGICRENHHKIGRHRPVIFNCTHSICAQCYSSPLFLSVGKCPYCRDTLVKKALLVVFNS
mgnify:FL=1